MKTTKDLLLIFICVVFVLFARATIEYFFTIDTQSIFAGIGSGLTAFYMFRFFEK